MLEILVHWSGPPGRDMVSVFHYNGSEPSDLVAARGQIAGMLGNFDGALSNAYTWTIANTADVINPANGVLIGEVGDSTPRTGTGAQAGQPVPDAAQVLIQWRTSGIVDGRRVRGRQFIPGLPIGALGGGNIKPADAAALTDVVQDFVDAAAGGFVIWQRPRKARGGDRPLPARAGSVHEVTFGTVWEEMAVQRRRRA